MSLVLRRLGGGAFVRRSLDRPVPAIMADGIGGVCRRGWQYWIEEEKTMMPPDHIPPEGSAVDDPPLPVAITHVGCTSGLSSNTKPGGLPKNFKLGWQSPDRPAPTIVAGPSGRGDPGWLREGPVTDSEMPSDDAVAAIGENGKRPYRVPSMDEIAAAEPNGFVAASTFSGCGGSSLGYRMAGFRVAWASEFVPAARETYRANASPETILDGRDIREVAPDDILDAIGIGVGELDLLDGSPPCASFSTAGKKHKGWGEAKKYSDRKQRSDDLFFEFARLVDGIRPKTFVAENVSGLVKGTAKGYFLEILRRLKAPGYRVSARLLDAQWLGVPQARSRLIFVGVRDDLGIEPVHPDPLPYRYSVRDALPWLRAVGSIRSSGGFGRKRVMFPADRPAPTIMAGGGNGMNQSQFGVEAETDIARFAIGPEWSKLRPGGQSEKYFSLVRAHPDRPTPTITAIAGSGGVAGVTHPTEKRKFSIAELRRLCGFPDDFVLTGTYAQQWERLGRAVPPVMMAAIAGTVRDRILVPAREAADRDR